MFALPQLPLGTKRRREEDGDDLVFGSTMEDGLSHESKKLRALPFRTSPTIKHTSLFSQTHTFVPRPQTLTPVESSDDESDDDFERPATPSSQRGRLAEEAYPNPAVNDDDDMDMSDSNPRVASPPAWQTKATSSFASCASFRTRSPPRPSAISTSGNNFLSAPSNHAESTGRLPTPIYGHFNQVAAPASTSLLGVHQNPVVTRAIRTSGPISPIPASPMSPSETSATAPWWHRGRLPSPAEDQDGDLDMTPLSPSIGVLDNMLPKLNVSPPSRPNTIGSDIELSTTAPPGFGRGRSEGMPRSPSFGRARSNATSSPTNPNTVASSNSTGSGSSRLSMGYRADCEKCIKRVPGHYTHIIRG